ncbi:hypothetical protein GCM10010404_90540 [Nonomuraea africana]|uniref:SnoaL-like domain-containing protein n=1 Tax=Nonomuraea africana TaxID=46171 RepID=A0ABR9KDK6_9ACTN|nr:nuclear transport factor 2 family protein [Nonomuraea africana]MBE1560020.1 hypothetical protein [Nonomuraea africana]
MSPYIPSGCVVVLLHTGKEGNHPGMIQLEGDTAAGRTYVSEFGRMRDGSSHLNYSVYHDRYQRTPDGWKFTERVYEVKYVDTTPLAGSAPHAAPGVYARIMTGPELND